MAKRFQILSDATTDAKMIYCLSNPMSSNYKLVSDLVKDTASKSDRNVTFAYARNLYEIEAAFAQLAQLPARAVLIMTDALFTAKAGWLGTLSARFNLPAIYQLREFVESGGLLGYGPNIKDAYLSMGRYVGRILRGAAPADTPVEQQTRIEFLINMKTAKSLGLQISPTLLARTDEIIE